MSINENSAMSGSIEQLLKNTLNGQVDWVSANPTTFIWQRNTPPPARITMQRVVGKQAFPQPGGQIKVVDEVYILQVTDLSTGTTPININSGTSDELTSAIVKLYNAIASKAAEKRVEFFNRVIS